MWLLSWLKGLCLAAQFKWLVGSLPEASGLLLFNDNTFTALLHIAVVLCKQG